MEITEEEKKQLQENILEEYDVIKEVLKERAQKATNRRWTRFRGNIVYKNWKCDIAFDWRVHYGHFIIGEIDIEPREKFR